MHHVKEALERLDGLSSAEVSLEAGTALVTLTKDVTDEAIRSAVDEAGYDAVKIEAA